MAQEKPVNPVNWFEIYVNDMNKASKFYESVLDTKLQDMSDPTNSGMKFFTFPFKENTPNATGALVQMEGMKAGGNSTIVYFNCLDCAVEEARVEKNGGKIFKKKMSIDPHGFMSLCIDPDGNKFGLHSMQ